MEWVVGWNTSVVVWRLWQCSNGDANCVVYMISPTYRFLPLALLTFIRFPLMLHLYVMLLILILVGLSRLRHIGVVNASTHRVGG